MQFIKIRIVIFIVIFSEVYGVFCKRSLLQHTLFGPLLGVPKDISDPLQASPFVTKLDNEDLSHHQSISNSNNSQNSAILSTSDTITKNEKSSLLTQGTSSLVPSLTSKNGHEEQFSEEGKTSPLRKNLKFPFTNINGEVQELDTSDAEQSNWMRFVRDATEFSHVNCHIVERGEGKLFFLTSCAVAANTELRVAPSEQYAASYGLHAILPSPHDLQQQQEEDSWPCYECDQKFDSSKSLQQHLACHDKFVDKKKTRGRRGKTRKGSSAVQQRVAVTQTTKRTLAADVDMAETDGDNVELRCLACKKIFTNVHVFTLHQLLHSNKPEDQQRRQEAAQTFSTTCPQCNKVLQSFQRLLWHLDSHALSLSPRPQPLKRNRTKTAKVNTTSKILKLCFEN